MVVAPAGTHGVGSGARRRSRRRRLANFKANRRGYVSAILFLALFAVSLFADLIANDRPLLVRYEGRLYFPVLVAYPETEFGGFFETEADYTDPAVRELIEEKGWIVWPPIPYSYDTVVRDLPTPAPSPPTAQNWLGTDDQARDVLARIIYGFRISVLFGLALTLLSSVVGVAAGAVQGYFGGLVDLSMQRFMEIWGGMPTLYLLIIMSSMIVPGFWTILVLMLLFSWMTPGRPRPGRVPARPQSRLRPRRQGARRGRRHHHVPPHPAQRHGLDPDLHALRPQRLDRHPDLARFPGLRPAAGLALAGRAAQSGQEQPARHPGSASRASSVLAVMLSLLVFAGEAVRDAFDPRKTFR